MPKFRPIATYLLPGSFFPEDEERELPERSVEAAVAAAPPNAYAFKLHDRPICDFEFNAQYWRIVPIAQNESLRYYLGGEVFTPDQIRDLAIAEGTPGRYDTLIANVEGNRWGRAIRCPTGNWQPFEEGDTLVPV